MVDTSFRYRMIVRDLDRQAERQAAAATAPSAEDKARQIGAETAYYKQRAASITSVDALLADERMLGIVLKAFDLEHAAGAKGLLRRVLTEGPRALADDKPSAAQTIDDQRYLALSAALDFPVFKGYTLVNTSVSQAVLSRYRAAVERQAPPAPNVALAVDRRTEMNPKVQRETAFYLANVDKIGSIEDFLKSGRVFNYAMRAFGLEDMIGSKGIIRKVLQSDLADPASFARRLSDERFRALATAFNFRELGEDATRLSTVRGPVVDAYKRQVMEINAGDEDEGVRLALNFRRSIATMALPTTATGLTDEAVKANNIMKFLAEPALATVVRTAVGLSADTARSSLDGQVRALAGKFDPATLQRDTRALDAFVNRFVARWSITEAGASSGPTSPALALFTNETGAATESLLLSLQSLRLGGR